MKPADIQHVLRRASWILRSLGSCVLFFFSLSLWSGSLAAQEGSDPEAVPEVEEILLMGLGDLGKVQIEVASPGNPQTISQAPAVATVITAEQIQAMGATRLGEVLEEVPGLHFTPIASGALGPVFSFRGIASPNNTAILFLVNGIPVSQALVGGAIITLQMPVANIQRVEVIRGPGSSVYGADAFAGVINLISKKAKDIDGTEVGIRLGSFETRDIWLQHGAKLGGWDFSLGLEWQTSDGDRDRIIEADSQSSLDQAFGTDASLAPGPLETRFEVLDAHLGLSKGPWQANAWLWDLNDLGVGQGSGGSLDNNGGFSSTQILTDLQYRKTGVGTGGHWDLNHRLSFLYVDRFQNEDLKIFPPGALLPIGADGNVNFVEPVGLVLFPDGFIGNPGSTERAAAVDTYGTYTGYEGHRLRFGVGFVNQEINTEETVNFGPGVIDGTQPVVVGTLTDVTGTPFIYMEDQERDLWYVSLQDEWMLSKNWELTAGLRYDRYSDFGGTLNPRAALVWTTSDKLTTKFLYGSAFRAPSFIEQFLINNPVRLGNPELEPETIDTFELAFDYRPQPKLRAALNLFFNDIQDLIDFVPDAGANSLTAQNAIEQEGYGFEIEVFYRATDRLQLRGNFAYGRQERTVQDSPGFSNERLRVANVPGQELYCVLDWQMSENWLFDGRLHWFGDRVRGLGDPRPEIDDATLVHLALRKKFDPQRLDVALVVRNALDEDAREPSVGDIPGDYPLEGRRVLLEMRYSF